MTDPHRPKRLADEGSRTDTALAQGQEQSAEDAAKQAPSAAVQDTEAKATESAASEPKPVEAAPAASSEPKASGPTAGDAKDAEAIPGDAEDAESKAADAKGTDPKAAANGVKPRERTARPKMSKKDLFVGAASGALVVLAVLALAAFVWPGFLAGPGKPDDQAAAAVSALANKDTGALEAVSCHGPDGKPVAQMPPQALQLIQTATQTGPAHLSLDTQARVPIDLTLSSQGQTQKLPVDVVLGVTNRQWCMVDISQQQTR